MPPPCNKYQSLESWVSQPCTWTSRLNMSHSARLRLHYQPLFGKWARSLPRPFLFSGRTERATEITDPRPTFEVWHSSLGIMRSSFDKIKQYFTYQYTLRVVYPCAILHKSNQKRILKKKTVLVHQEKRGKPRRVLNNNTELRTYTHLSPGHCVSP